MPIETKRARRRDIFVDYVQVTSENMAELAQWCSGKIRRTGNGAKYIFVHVLYPKEPKQSRAFVGDYLLYSPTGFKVYTERGFTKVFEDWPEEEAGLE